ncbi:MAG TPA: DUF5677 domain-containing protein [Terriglobales bacterium]|jgi:hypothetical protein|nr:DUF5677 domain-containing protein [Terriglobales bacterium]
MIGNAEAIEEMLGPKVDIGSVSGETSRSKVTTLAFELYKETIRVLNLAAHILDQAASASGGLPRNQAICAGLLIRMVKFMIAVLQLTCKDDRGEVVLSLTRSIMESAFDLEFLVRANDDKHFNDFVEHSLGAERELYDLIQANIAKRNDGTVLPIEKRMLSAVDRLCDVSGVKVGDVHPKWSNWAGGLKQRLQFLQKEEQYVFMHRLPSHAVHGTWVDLYKQHLEYDLQTKLFSPRSKWRPTDARAFGPTGVFVLCAVEPYVEKYFSAIPESKLLLERIDDLRNRIAVETAHEQLIAGK